jgi:hypothetical protein
MTARAGARPGRSDANRSRSRVSRDQGESVFASILAFLVADIPGARAAALVDSTGETVDYAGEAPPIELRVAAAHWRIVLAEAESQPSLGGLQWFVVRAVRRSYVICGLPDGYALVILLARAAGFVGWHRAVATCGRALSAEAGWKRPTDSGPAWFRVDVVADGRRRPRSVRVAGSVHPVEILGALAGRGELERRARQASRGWKAGASGSPTPTRGRRPGGGGPAEQAGRQER